jgi:hypothetical protein
MEIGSMAMSDRRGSMNASLVGVAPLNMALAHGEGTHPVMTSAGQKHPLLMSPMLRRIMEIMIM